MKKRVWIIVMMVVAAGFLAELKAEIAPEIIEIMKKSDAIVSRPEGVKMEMDVKASIALISINMHITSLDKDNKNRMMLQTSVFGKILYSEEGCDGVQGWTYDRNDLSKTKRDTLTIYPATSLESDYAVELDTYKDYENAKMKHKNGVYEIVLTKPKSSYVPDKTTVRIDDETFYPKEMQMKESGATISIKIKEISFGVDDKELAFDLKNYPDAVVVRKESKEE